MKLNPYILYNLLIENIGEQDWWPVDKEYHKKNGTDQRFEIIIGSILTQNTSWSNVEKALSNLKSNKMIDIEKMNNINIELLQKIIKPSGFFKLKAKRLKNLSSYLHKNYNDNLNIFFDRKLNVIRNELLSINGIGQETADTILLYAGKLPIFIVDSYTKRICKRLPLIQDIYYDKIQKYFQIELSNKFPKNDLVEIYNEFHALIVILCKEYCKKKNTKCKKCVISKYCSYNKKNHDNKI